MPSDAPTRYLTNTFVQLFDEIADKPERKWMIDDLGRGQYIREFNTVMLHLPRQTGKTTALIQILKKHGETAALIAANHAIAENIARVADLHRRDIWVAPSAMNHLRGKTIHQRYFLFDEWQYIQKSKMDEMIHAIHFSRPHTAPLPIFFGLGTR